MNIVRTHVKTWPLLNAWASTLPWPRDPGNHAPMVSDLCAVPLRGGQLVRPFAGHYQAISASKARAA